MNDDIKLYLEELSGKSPKICYSKEMKYNSLVNYFGKDVEKINDRFLMNSDYDYILEDLEKNGEKYQNKTKYIKKFCLGMIYSLVKFKDIDEIRSFGIKNQKTDFFAFNDFNGFKEKLKKYKEEENKTVWVVKFDIRNLNIDLYDNENMEEERFFSYNNVSKSYIREIFKI